MKTFLIFLVLLVLSRIETNEATRNLDKTHLLLPPLMQTRPPARTPTPNSGTEASHVNMASTVVDERNFVGRKEIVFAPPHINAHPLDKTHLLLPSLMQTRPPIRTPTPNPGTEASHVNMASTVTERNFVGRKEVVFAPPPINAHPLDKTHLLLPSLMQTRPPIRTPTPNPGTEASHVNMASTVTERNFVGRKEVFTPPPTNAYPLDKSHLLLPSLQTRPPVRTPSPNPGTEASVNITSTVTERNFVGRKEVSTPPTTTNTSPVDKSHLLLPSLQTRPPVKTPSPNPGTEASVNMTNTVTERNFVGRKEVSTPPPPTNASPLDKTHLLLPSLQTRPPVRTPSSNPGTEASVNITSTVTERNFVGRTKVI